MTEENKIRDIGDRCTPGDRDTSFGSGLVVNRVPSETDEATGYMCPECQMMPCDDCEKSFDDDDLERLSVVHQGEVDEIRVCPECLDKRKPSFPNRVLDNFEENTREWFKSMVDEKVKEIMYQPFHETGKDLLRTVVSHEVDVITDGDWFEELVERKVKEIMDRRGDA